MSGRWFVNLLLLMALLAAGAAIRRDLAQTLQGPTLAEVFLPELRQIEIARADEPAIRLERATTGWRQTAPLNADADPARVGRLLALLDAPVSRTFPAQGAALDQLDLTAPRLRLRFDALHLAFGGLDPVGGYRYVESEGLIHLIEERFHQPLLAPPIDYVAPWPIPRDFVPAFGTFDGVPLDVAVLNGLGALNAERVEPLAGEVEGTLLELTDPEGRPLRFLVSDDGRRWSRPDQRLRYVLARGPVLIDEPPPLAPVAAPAGTPSPPPSFALDPNADPETPLSGDLPPGPLPAVRLRPDGVGSAPGASGYGAEPDKEPPSGFGQNPFDPEADPFAPDPVADPGLSDPGADPFAPPPPAAVTPGRPGRK